MQEKGENYKFPANTTHWNNVGLMSGQRRRRWANIEPTLFQCVENNSFLLNTWHARDMFYARERVKKKINARVNWVAANDHPADHTGGREG